ncbi:indolepyruvate ferredoxin oxidoreductase [Pseudovibrio axinellae]|uniref:Indolepyruvate ferredoxin oxidoreductase n=1 Tax=Pseudovibrio axinellae TaxID=989403 RepID=A0A165SZ88_9HYPH|nr:indolepyruvate ferredoxin oxidoreductase family protein [Pseudovibrio axinellae]KZL05058.1 indolepyruvate ferredoxin oxidoreductase [Pseudovibrio axinellae]SER66222.1 indolepyruvate ferredoxin oxidoreductase [Pseudovibrio axinellae]
MPIANNSSRKTARQIFYESDLMVSKENSVGSSPSKSHNAPSLDDKYTQTSGVVFLTGNQALVRLPLQQRMRDELAGLNTGAFISGYRGSPLGRYDMELWRAQLHLDKHSIVFQPGVNEDLAATAIWGSQHVGNMKMRNKDGVVGFWYGKTPGVDRSGDAFRHANFAGTHPKGGVVALCGDDHAAKSSTVAGQSDHALIASGIPVLYPANPQDILDYGVLGVEMSRYSGCWVGLKLVTDVVESASSVEVDLDRVTVVEPDLKAPPGGVWIREIDMPVMQEKRLLEEKIPRALAFAQANNINTITHEAHEASIGIIGVGKAYSDLRQAMNELGMSALDAEKRGIRILKVGMVWPLDPEIIKEFSKGVDKILVIEEKRPLVEEQLKSILFDAGLTPKVIGKGLLARSGVLSANQVAAALAEFFEDDVLKEKVPQAIKIKPGPVRRPSFCSGCPHNTSTKLPDGSRALAGIGCHTIAYLNDPVNTKAPSQMGGEGMHWVGQAPFTDEPHVFANMGDGTYFHSGFLAIRQAVAAKTTMTYKLLVNGFVSMTGGQPVDGEQSVPQLVTAVLNEGASKVVIVTEDVERVTAQDVPAGIEVHHRRELEAVQRDLRDMEGVSVLIYDQACATERRRLRKRGKWEDPKVRTFIHPEICEGCGDCGEKSGCLSIEPLETPLGRKRQINQSSCNKDFSCVEGFCPSFVTIHGAEPKKALAPAERKIDSVAHEVLEEPELPAINGSTGLLVTGIGGTGVVTIGAILSMAAHLDGRRVSTLDLTGLAQKYGAVTTHMRIANTADNLQSARLAVGEADVVIGCDLVVTAGDETLTTLRSGSAQVVVNSEEVPTAEFSRNPDWQINAPNLKARLHEAVGDRLALFDTTQAAKDLCGDAVMANMMLLGVAWQSGLVPVTLGSIRHAIELNGVAREKNFEALNWGRLMVLDPERVASARAPLAQVHKLDRPLLLEELIEDRVKRLKDYQGTSLGKLYRQKLVALKKAGAGDQVLRTAATQYFRLLAHKDEFEVARLFSHPSFKQSLEDSFEGDLGVRFHIGGGPFAKKDRVTGQPVKTEFGPWMMRLFIVLSSLRGLRGTVLDPFRNNEERALAFELRSSYELDMDLACAHLRVADEKVVDDLLSWPLKVRGFGHVRAGNAEKALKLREKRISTLTKAHSNAKMERVPA